MNSGEIVSIDFMIKILASIEECVESIALKLATDSIDGKCLHDFFSPLRLLDCRFLRTPLPAFGNHWSASSLAVEKIYSKLTSAENAISAAASVDLSELLTADHLQPPSFAVIRNWLKSVTISRIAEVGEIDGSIFSPLKLVLILPTAMIQAIMNGEIADFSSFPQGQVNFALTLASAIHKIGHWIRQNCFETWSIPLSLMITPLTRAQVAFTPKCPLTFKGGLLHWHNQSYIAGTTLLSSIVPFEVLSLAQRQKAIVFDLQMSIRDIAGLRSKDCLEHGWQYLRHLPVPPIAVNCYPALMTTIDADGMEADISGDTDWNEDSTKPITKKLPPINIQVAGYDISVKPTKD